MISKLLKTRAKKVGLPPGTLVTANGKVKKEIEIDLVDFDADTFIEKKHATLNDCRFYLDTPRVTWINICGIDDATTVASIGKEFGLHPLMMEDIMSVGQRSKIDDYKDTIYIVVKMLIYNVEKQAVDEEQVSIVLGKNFVISFLESTPGVFQPIYDRLHQKRSRMRQRGADYLCYALIDCLVDNYFIILEKVDQKLENLETELFHRSTPNTMRKIQSAKREISMLRKSVWPVREVVSNFRRLETPLIQDATKLYIQDVYDHTIQAIDTIETFRDISGGMLDIYMSNLSQRMNEVMKFLTVVSTIFVPLTFIASLYGMNFDYIPEIHSKWGYPMVLCAMVLVSLFMLFFFKRKKWI